MIVKRHHVGRRCQQRLPKQVARLDRDAVSRSAGDHCRANQPQARVEQERAKDDSDPKAVACYGLVIRQAARASATLVGERMLCALAMGGRSAA